MILDNRIVASSDDIRKHLGEAAWQALANFDRDAKDWMTATEYYESDCQHTNGDPVFRKSFRTLLSRIGNESARRYLETLVHSDLATEPHKTNGTYGLQNYLMNDSAYMKLYSIVGGNERLPEELSRRIDATVRLRQPVIRVEKSADSRLQIVSRRAGQIFKDSFDFVIVALPNNLIPRIDWRGSRLSAAMKEHHQRYNFPAHYLRVTMLFECPFWRDRLHDSYTMLDAFGGCCLYDESSRNGCDTFGVLGWLLGGKPALELSRRSDEDLIESMLSSLPSFLKHGARFYLEGRVHRWPFAVNGLPGGAPALDLDTRHVPEPKEHPNLLVVGDYLFDSTLNGVLDSADFATDWLVAELEHADFNNATDHRKERKYRHRCQNGKTNRSTAESTQSTILSRC
ncbi:MAG: hypothetical protein KatS3mg105_2484 [Gemmatales bacterium]|nr:MAG: hypothetical protein KatS3mg105_2484 [Gemmatales bacterium]